MFRTIHTRLAAIDQRHDTGPFDIIGDVHGCADELEALLDRLGYRRATDGSWRSPDGRTPVFVGDLVDRGPRVVDVLRLVMDMTAAGVAFAVPGNHDVRLARHLMGDQVPIAHGMDVSLRDLDRHPAAFREAVVRLVNQTPGHYVFDEGRLVVAHAGLAADRHGRGDEETRMLAVFGFIDGDIEGSDVASRHPWLADYRGEAAVVFGHTPIPDPAWVHRSIDIDTGCVYGWRLTALRWPERELVQVDAVREYAAPPSDFAGRSATDGLR